MYRTQKYYISKSSYLYNYLHQLTGASAALYNRANFIIRQYATAMDSFEQMKPLYATQMEVFKLVQKYLLGTEYMPKGKWLSYKSLDYLLKTIKDPAYYALPAQANQQILKHLLCDYKGFFGALKSWKANPPSFTGRPKLPKYAKGLKTAFLTSQICKIKANSLGFPVLSFPKARETFRIGAIPANSKLKEVRIKPTCNKLVLEAVFDTPQKGIPIREDKDVLAKLGQMQNLENLRVMSLDPGVNNLVAITNNFGEAPVLIKGGALKSINQFYNKQVAYYQAIAKTVNDRFYTRRLNQITDKRNRRIRDLMHKASRQIVNLAVQNRVNLVILGHNNLQKQQMNIGDSNNQNFVQIPFRVFAEILRYKLAEEGITFVCAEESYSSKADYLAKDNIPVFKKNNKQTYAFSGIRVKRGLYRHFDGTISNADINGSANIMRKVFPQITQWDADIVKMPCAKIKLVA